MAWLLIVLGTVALIPVLSLLNGTILYYVWPVTMVEVFHFPPLTWWQAVCLSWVAGILVRSTQTNTNK